MRRVLTALGRHKAWTAVGGVVVVVAVATGLGQVGVSPSKDTAGLTTASSTPALDTSSTSPGTSSATPAPAPSTPAPTSSSDVPQPPPPSPSSAPSVFVSDNPAFDMTGSGDACRMHYFQDDQDRTVTLFDLAQDGELITHVSGPDGIGRHDEQFTRGVNRIVYDFPLSQATDMGAVLYLSDGSQQSCTIGPGATAP